MQRITIKKAVKLTNKELRLAGWVHVRRDHGKLIFIDLKDASGIMQIIFAGEDILKTASTLRPGDVVEIEGIVQKRPEKMFNKELESGEVEFSAKKLIILNSSETIPFDLISNGYEVNEELRLKHRYLDLRRERMQKNIKERHKITQFIRNYLSDKGFTEIETPLLTKSTPEGARDYVVPSRMQPGKFYALPQAPQQYKQLLMVAGFEKYFQFAKCLRDEDTRGDRQPEFTQLDMEMSFVKRENVMNLAEKMIIAAIKKLYPRKKIKEIPFPRLSYKDSVDKYSTDRPDLRDGKNDPDELAFCWVIDFPFFEKTEELNPDGSARWTFTHNPFSAAMPKYHKKLMEKKDIDKIIAAQYDMVLNGFEIGGGSIRNNKPEALEKVLEIMSFGETQIKKNFGHMLEAFKYGAPPHGGFAFGIDRLLAILSAQESIREVITFPKTSAGTCPLTSAPSEAKELPRTWFCRRRINLPRTR